MCPYLRQNKPKMVNAPEGLNQFFLGRLEYIYREPGTCERKKERPCFGKIRNLSRERERERKGPVSEKFGTFQERERKGPVSEKFGTIQERERERERERGRFQKNSEKIRTYVAICT